MGRERIEYKTADQIRLMRAAGLVVAEALDAVAELIVEGTTTAQLDAVAEQVIRGAGAIPSFIGVGHPPFPSTLCVSVNEEVVHGIPGPRVLRAGDVVSVDCGAVLKGWHGDAAFSAVVPGPPDTVDPDDLALNEATREGLWHGIAALAVGERLNVVGAAVQDSVGDRYSLVEDYGGHGIGTSMHQPPHVLNYRTRDAGPRLKAGICLAIEPMLTRGSPATLLGEDRWTVVTQDGTNAAHWEHTVALTKAGLWVLTARDGGEAELARLSAPFAPLD
ncbi:MAG: type methionyl aminopeptidase [Actinomycetota bacterium]|nr:type methionyl aminopeptidase [Actinomycetota bacterium]